MRWNASVNVAVSRVLRCWRSGSWDGSNKMERRVDVEDADIDIGDADDEQGDVNGNVDVGKKNLGQASQVNVRTRSVKSRLDANTATNFSS